MSLSALTKEEQDVLLALARDAIAGAIGVGKGSGSLFRIREHFPHDGRKRLPEPFSVRAGAFVTIHLDDALRGCVGYLESDRPLDEVVRRCAVSAATADARFPALTSAEWPRVSVEISVLGPIAPIADVSEVEVGRHGLMAQLGQRRGILLPQVATEWQWDREQFASHTCRKAGLPADAWRNGATLSTFEAQVFGDP